MLNEVLVGYLQLFLETKFEKLAASAAGCIIRELRNDNQFCLGYPSLPVLELTIEIDPLWYGIFPISKYLVVHHLFMMSCPFQDLLPYLYELFSQHLQLGLVTLVVGES